MKKLLIIVTCFMLMASLGIGKVEAASAKAFYGIWISATKNPNEAIADLFQAKEKGFKKAQIYDTTDWSNLNRKKYYVISTNQYKSKGSANKALSTVKRYYKGAYVKYTGSYKSRYSSLPDGLYGADGYKVPKENLDGIKARIKNIKSYKSGNRYVAVINGQVEYAPLQDGIFMYLFKSAKRTFPLSKNCKYDYNDKKLSRKQFFKKVSSVLNNHTIQITIINDTIYEITVF